MRAGQLCGPMGKVRTQRPPSDGEILDVAALEIENDRGVLRQRDRAFGAKHQIAAVLYGDLRHHFYRRVEQRLLNHNHAGMVRVAKVELGMSEHR